MDLSSAQRRHRGHGDSELRVIQQDRRRARNSHELTELFTARAELRGVSRVADFFADSVHWSA